MTQQSSSMGGQGTPTTASEAVHEVTNQIKDTAGQVTNQAQQVAGQVVDQTRQQMSSRISGQKDRAAEGLTSVAQALRQTGQQLRDQDQQAITGYIDNVASQVERVSNYLKHNDLGNLVDDVEQFARRQPAVFLGSAFVLGLIGARFLRSSRPYTGTAGGYTGGTYMAQQQARYYRGYPSEAAVREANAVPNYGPGTKSGSYSTTGGSTTDPLSSSGTGASGSYSTTGGSTTGSSSSSGTGARSYDQRREE